MTTQTISGTYGYVNLTYPVTGLSVTSTGYVQQGVAMGGGHTANYFVVNSGRIESVYGAAVRAIYGTDSVTNGSNGDTGALIDGKDGAGVWFQHSSGSVSNFGSIFGSAVYDKAKLSVSTAGVFMGTGKVTNGSDGDTKARIEAGAGVFFTGAGTVSNFGRIIGDSLTVQEPNYSTLYASAGVHIGGAGIVTNGSAIVKNALIKGLRGVYIFGFGTVTNFGTIEGHPLSKSDDGVYFSGGGRVTNGSTADETALVLGYQGLVAGGAATTLTNFGTVHGTGTKADRGAVAFYDGGTVTNGASKDTKALIRGREGVTVEGAAGTVTNFGMIEGKLTSGGLHGIYLGEGGRVTNGSTSSTSACVAGFQSGVAINHAAGTVRNFGVIKGLEAAGGQAGISLAAGGYVSNGASGDTGARIDGNQGVIVKGARGTVVNFGLIAGDGSTVRGAVALYDGGVLTNHSGALISGREGVTVKGGAGTVTNLGLILGDPFGSAGLHGVWLDGGGKVTNGSATDTGAEIDSYQSGVAALSGALTVYNFGAIVGNAAGAGEAGISASAAGYVFNGTSADTKAHIEGADGVLISGHGGVDNYATIEATGTTSGYGLAMEGGGVLSNRKSGLIEGYGGLKLQGSGLNLGAIIGTASGRNGFFGAYGAVLNGKESTLTNGFTGDTTARISGYTGVQVNGSGTLINYGTILSTAREAVVFSSSSGTLVAEAGSSFVGGVTGGGGTLILGSGVGTISGLAGGNVTVSKSMPTTTFDDFATVEVGAGATFSLSGAASLAAGATLADAGALIVSNSVSGGGTLSLRGAGELALNAGTSLTIAKVSQTGATSIATVGVANLAYAGAWVQSAGTLSASAGDRITFTGTGDSFSGVLAGAGVVAFTGGSDTLNGTTLTASSVIINGPAVTLSGKITLADAVNATTANLIIAAGGATLTGGGSLTLTNLATNRIVGATSAAVLTNDATIIGAGLLGDGKMALVNGASGIIDGDHTAGLTIDTGANTITNAGTIEATSGGFLTIDSAIANNGLLAASGGTLTVKGAVSGIGSVAILNDTADFTSTLINEDVAFTGSTGVLELAHSQSYDGAVTGFSKSGKTAFDLGDIAFVSGTTKATYAGTASLGTLTVTDGTHTAKIILFGDYLSSTFTVSSDGHGGTTVVDPSAPPGATRHPLPVHQFIAAAARFGALDAGASQMIAEPWRGRQALMSAPRAQIA